MISNIKTLKFVSEKWNTLILLNLTSSSCKVYQNLKIWNLTSKNQNLLLEFKINETLPLVINETLANFKFPVSDPTFWFDHGFTNCLDNY